MQRKLKDRIVNINKNVSNTLKIIEMNSNNNNESTL